MTPQQLTEIPKFEAWLKHYWNMDINMTVNNNCTYPSLELTAMLHAWLAAKSDYEKEYCNDQKPIN